MKRQRARKITPDFASWFEVRTRDGRYTCEHQTHVLFIGPDSALPCAVSLSDRGKHMDIWEVTRKVRWSNYRKNEPGCPRCGRGD